MQGKSAARDLKSDCLYCLDASHTHTHTHTYTHTHTRTHSLLPNLHFLVQWADIAGDADCASYYSCYVSLLLADWQTVRVCAASPPQMRSNTPGVFVSPPALHCSCSPCTLGRCPASHTLPLAGRDGWRGRILLRHSGMLCKFAPRGPAATYYLCAPDVHTHSAHNPTSSYRLHSSLAMQTVRALRHAA
jgi:hypothetical protein